ncbi:hypothetical protein I553_10699 [Mycobacterium xenopi 4042]|uniref:Uncharacterized protein n=1 Tax=Mycobacterium xenopi 4042 TaxID=1299334 RepID=X8D9V9_MYCXE|nr:hypothetical protein I552_0456 [Mycobacterium xenopi 3993]EUA65402.1 hypothetical protein I553_10699 [Mycobacterium xenopi 4042]
MIARARKLQSEHRGAAMAFVDQNKTHRMRGHGLVLPLVLE